MSNENTRKPKNAKDRITRTELFKQVAVAVLASRPAVVLKGAADGAVLSPQFVDEVSLITDGILNAATTFGEK